MNINYLQIWTTEKNYPQRLNECISNLPNEWICLTDPDTLKFPNFGNYLPQILEKAHDNDLITCITNRLNPVLEQVDNDMYNISDVGEHLKHSEKLWQIYKTELTPIKIVAGNCMIFHKSLWTDLNGFPDDCGYYFDSTFTELSRRNGSRILAAKGLYLFHLYRWGKPLPQFCTAHLRTT